MKRSWLAFLTYAVLTVALTYPLIRQLGSVLPNDPGDPALNTWLLWWNAHAVPYTSTWWNAPNFYPVAGALAFSEHLLGLSLISTPVQWMGGTPQQAYNVVFLLTFPLCALGAYLLAREITGPNDAAFIAGLLFGFAPYRIAHLPQIQVLAAFAMPLSLLGLHRYLRDPRPRWLAVFAGFWLLQALCNGYYLLFFSVLVGMWTLWFASPWRVPRTFLAIVAAGALATIPLAPLLLKYQAIHRAFGFTRDFGAIRDFGADTMALLNAAGPLAFWGWLRVYKRAEGELFPGLTIVALVALSVVLPRAAQQVKSRGWMIVRRVLLALAILTGAVSISALAMGSWQLTVFGIRLFSVSNPVKPLTFSLALVIGLALTSRQLRFWYSTRSVLGFYAVAAFVMWLFSLGPSPSLMGKPFMYRGPYALLMILPGFNALRVPARFWMMATLCLAMIGALLFDRVASRLRVNRLVAAVVVSLGVMADGWVADFPLARAPSPAAWMADRCGALAAGSALLELPLGDSFHDVAAMYRSMAHGHPVVNGYSGYFPPHYGPLRFGLSMRDDQMLTLLSAHDVTSIVIDAANDRDGAWRRYVAAHKGAEVVCAEGGQTLFRLNETPAARTTSRGAPLALAAIRPSLNGTAAGNMTDGDRSTRWESGPQSDRTSLEIDLGAVRSVDAIVLMLGPYVEDFPRQMAIDVSDDETAWNEVWRGGSAALAFEGAFETPGDVAMTYSLGRARARYLRLRLLANDETYYWSIAELKVLGS